MSGYRVGEVHPATAEVPENQSDRNEAFLAAVRDGRSDLAGRIALADPLPGDAPEDESQRWRIRRRLYRRAEK